MGVKGKRIAAFFQFGRVIHAGFSCWRLQVLPSVFIPLYYYTMTASLKQLLPLLLVGTAILGNVVLVDAFTYYSHSVRQSSVRCRSSELFGFDWKKNPFTSSAFSFGTNTQREDDDVNNEAARRMKLKQELLERCSSLPESKDKRAQIEETIQALAQLNPTSDAATNPRLQKQWNL